LVGRLLRWPRDWWVRQSLRARLTLLATALFSFAVITGAVLLIVLQRYALTRVLDSSASKTAKDIAAQFADDGRGPTVVSATTGGIAAVQVLDAGNHVIASTSGTEHSISLVTPEQLAELRSGERIDIDSTTSGARLRVLGQAVGGRTVIVLTDLTRIDDSLRVLTRAALIGGPLAVLLMGLLTYAVVSITLRPVAALRHGAADITAAGLAEQRLPVPGPQDEIHRLAVTLNAMLDRIDSATSRQRTFVGDAAHELRSPLASLRVQLEVGARLGPSADWSGLIDDVLVDVDRLDRLVADLLALARLDESASLSRREPVPMAEVVAAVLAGYGQARVPVRSTGLEPLWTEGDPDALRRVVINLVNNATRYSAGPVEVGLRTVREDARDFVELTVDDDGPGIREAERERVFDRFYRVQESRSRESGGTGLGLPIVRDIVRNHGGRVWLAARPDGRAGLRAIVRLPGRPVPAGD
jgi:signal transduction histidine kinase